MRIHRLFCGWDEIKGGGSKLFQNTAWGPDYVFDTSSAAYLHPFSRIPRAQSDIFFALQEEMSSSAAGGVGGGLSGRTERDSRRKKERLRLQPSVGLARLQTTAHRARAHASLPLSAIVARWPAYANNGPTEPPKTHTRTHTTAEHKRALVLVNREIQRDTRGGKIAAPQRTMTHFASCSGDKAGGTPHTCRQNTTRNIKQRPYMRDATQRQRANMTLGEFSPGGPAPVPGSRCITQLLLAARR